MTESELAESSDEKSSDETGPPWSRASGTSSIAATAAVSKSVDEVRPPGIAKYSAKGVDKSLEAIKDIPPELMCEETRFLRENA